MMATAAADGATDQSSSLRILIHGGDNMLGRAVQGSLPIQAPGEERITDSCTMERYLDMSLNHPSHQDGTRPELGLEEIRSQNARGGSYLWGDYRGLTISPPPDLRLLNLETAVTQSIHNQDVPHWKGIRYHLHADNFENVMIQGFQQETHQSSADSAEAEAGASPVVLSFANNHVMDYGRKALEEETLPLFDQLKSDHFQAVGCGRSLTEAMAPATMECRKGTVQVFGFSAGCSGTPSDWWATGSRSGLCGLPAIYNHKNVDTALQIMGKAFQLSEEDKNRFGSSRPLRVVSIHWGPNWAMKGEDDTDLAARRSLAHKLIDDYGVDLIYGHSSHHARGMEVYHNKLILYGTGDIINDYEGFENGGEEQYNRLGGIYLVDVDPSLGNLKQLKVVPMFMNRLRLERFTPESAVWKPNAQRLSHDPHLSQDFGRFLNRLSEMDAGGSETALHLEHFHSDPEIPGGPVLKFKQHQS